MDSSNPSASSHNERHAAHIHGLLDDRARWYQAVGALIARTGCDRDQAELWLHSTYQCEGAGWEVDQVLTAVEAAAHGWADPDAHWD